MSELHEALVVNGNFAKTEEYVEQFVSNGLIDNYCSKQKYKALWSVQDTLTNPDVKPGRRGGHQLIVDTNENRIYLFGGWDGDRDLSDLWYYDIKLNSWTLIHDKAEFHGGPSPRSCHKVRGRKILFSKVSATFLCVFFIRWSSIRWIRKYSA